ncbi:pentatricopeptide repeat-containing protein At2g13600-like [Selaginella moellendorffii]|uniref:pentatricopeptide repeat-containing protein At2g13600-like n=1 Tax=Selaginella moellendorffii TaxID=88036 RepID=UPI000D1C5947|nr:pentatricopeptide repeat-containing protein At2g13600-like [Selaginella moellendorffii]|eukprot:XP_024540343.1 pentatricopeptide repeat-containing protein At2g13600-like [Selaginella moellendorffii]
MACASLASQEQPTLGDLSGKDVKTRSLNRGREIVSMAEESGCGKDVFLLTAAIDMYAKCGSLAEAQKCFDRMPRHDTVSWNALLLGYVENEEADLALEAYQRMRLEKCLPNSRTLLALTMAYTALATKEAGELIYGRVVKTKSLEKCTALHLEAERQGFASDIILAGALVDMYSKCGSLADARRVFDGMLHHNAVAWKSLILGYLEAGEDEIVLELFGRMGGFTGCVGDSRVLVAALAACSSAAVREESTQLADGKSVKLRCFETAFAMHAQAVPCGCFSDIFVATALIDLYMNCGRILEAREVFDMMVDHDVVAWNALILGYFENDENELALEMFERMEAQGDSPNAATFVAVLSSRAALATREEGTKTIDGKLVKVKSLEAGMELHSQAARTGCDSDVMVVNALLDFYARCGSPADSRRVFDWMPCHSVVSWTSLVASYAENGEAELALSIFFLMEASTGFAPVARSFVAALKACGSLVALDCGRAIHAAINRDDPRSSSKSSSSILERSLVEFYGKCGKAASSHRIFDALASSSRDLSLWNSLLGSYSHQGDAARVLELFGSMHDEGLRGDGITFSCVLSVCGRTGMVATGRSLFQAMKSSEYGVEQTLEHFHCMVDLLGRANLLEEAMAMAKTMPFEATTVTWTILLSACCKWKNLDVGSIVFEFLLKLDSRNATPYILMSNLCK